MSYDPSRKIFELLQFGEFGDVNPSITDSSTFTFLEAQQMISTFKGEAEGCFLYSRHWNPTNKYLAEAMSAMEDTESAWITASGMAAITNTVLQLCNCGDHIISSITTYGGTFAFFENYLKKFQIEVSFVNITDHGAVRRAIRKNTRLIYTETITNPMLQVSDIPTLAAIGHEHGIPLVVDNTFSPLIVSPARLGADIVVYSMTKFINGKNDCVAGAICGSVEFINSLADVNSGTAMLLGPVLDPLRSSSILKNLHTLHIRMRKHGENAMYIANKFREAGFKTIYPGFEDHPQHKILRGMMNDGFGFGGMIAIDFGTVDAANRIMETMEMKGVGYLAVSLGYFKTLFSCSGKSTSSEVPDEVQKEIGLSEGLVRFSVGLDHDISKTWEMIEGSLRELKLI